MGLGIRNLCIFLFVTVILPVMCYSEQIENSLYTRATYYGSPDCYGTPSGACGFGDYGRNVNGGKVSGVSSRLYKNGTGCGACYQVRCKIPTHCNEEGTKMVVTDYGEGDRTDFILSTRAYSEMANPGLANELFALGVVDMEYRRIPCRYNGYNLMIQVHDKSDFPNYIAILPLYQSGLSDITAAQIWQADCKEWRDMRRVFGGVYDYQNPPKGSLLSFRLQTNLNGNTKWVEVLDVLPQQWKAGVAYDTNIQLD
ncbi:PREDICTED: expansin-like B1 [Ipomoea nil]|uniref:expansin-like B1 n=1 Tax=Ipomoea nil TaxID=35883 RepID=UPI000901737B|nr:PREDICTED: expansin-like B1 [Ipomoea nil]